MKKNIAVMAFCCFYSFSSIDLTAQEIETGGVKEVRKKFLYFLSFPLNHIQYKINKDISWWSEIEEGLVLGAMPLKKHLKELKKNYSNLSVLSLNERFETKKSLVAHPVSERRWQTEGVNFKQINVSD